MLSFKVPDSQQRVSVSRSWSEARAAILAFLIVGLATPSVSAQLDVLSAGDVDEQWRLAQISVLEDQLRSESVREELKQELTTQVTWLSSWRPGSLRDGSPKSAADQSDIIVEPTLDPNKTAKDVRARLLGQFARPQVADTQRLKRLLAEHPDDIGIRQLHLHWLDQLHYRKEYCDAIAEAARKLIDLLDAAETQNEERKWVKAFCLYRRGRALAYRELPDVIALRPIEDLETHEAALLVAYSQLIDLVGRGRPEFILLDVRMLRRDQWFGRALALLEKHRNVIDRKWYLKKRRDLLKELGWAAPSKEAAAIYAQEFPEAVAEEQKES